MGLDFLHASSQRRAMVDLTELLRQGSMACLSGVTFLASAVRACNEPQQKGNSLRPEAGQAAPALLPRSRVRGAREFLDPTGSRMNSSNFPIDASLLRRNLPTMPAGRIHMV